MLLKQCVVLGFTLALVRLAASEEFDGDPQCAFACFTKISREAGCPTGLTTVRSLCWCYRDKANFQSEIWPCLESSCTEEAMRDFESQIRMENLPKWAVRWADCANATWSTEIRGGKADLNPTPTRIPTIAAAVSTAKTLIASSSPPLPVDRGPASTSSSEHQAGGSSTKPAIILLPSRGSVTWASSSTAITTSSDLPTFSNTSPSDSNDIATDSRPVKSFSGLNPAAIGIGVGVGVTVLVFLYLAFFFFRRYRRKKEGSMVAGDESVVSPGYSDGLIPSPAALAPRKTELPAANIAEMPVHDDPTRGRVEAPYNERQLEIATEEGTQGRHELRGDEVFRAP